MEDKKKASFAVTHVVEPSTKHTHTAILLHGRGSSGNEFAQDLLSSTLSDSSRSLTSRFSGWRWVFPSSGTIWSNSFQEEIPSWFEAPSLADNSAGEDVQRDGVQKSVQSLHPILQEEISRLGGKGENVVLGGISQGAAVALWCLLNQFPVGRRIGGFMGASCWLPFGECIKAHSGRERHTARAQLVPSVSRDSLHFVETMMGGKMASLSQNRDDSVPSLLDTPIFLGHGSDDAYVDITLGRQARDVLNEIGFDVGWKEYLGAEQEGHWLKEPEEIDDFAAFLETVERNEESSQASSTG